MAADEKPPRLQPPPRVGDTADGRHGARSTGTRRTGIAVLFGCLIIALVGVFVVLPRWIADRPPAAGLTTGNGNVRATPEVLRPPTAAAVAGEDPPAAIPTPPPQPTPAISQRPQGSVPAAPAPAAPANEDAFVAAMSRGLQALERGDWDAAREAFKRASVLRPEAPEVADGLARTAAAERRALVTAGTRRGLELEASEDWARAEEAYLDVLKVKPEAARALEGRARAAERAAVDERLGYHIRNPGRLASPGVFEDAAELLADASELNPRGPRLEDQLSGLEEALEEASTPVPVVVTSDNLTEVVIYRVDRLGAFSRRELSLRPGTYTAVGSRVGFRDVRVQFTVAPGAAPKPVTVVCTERL